MNNNRNPDPIELAREVLQAVADERQTALTGSTLDNSLAIEELFDAALSAAPALAHAVTRIAELADELWKSGRESYQEGMDGAGAAYQASANLIRDALKGDDR